MSRERMPVTKSCCLLFSTFGLRSFCVALLSVILLGLTGCVSNWFTSGQGGALQLVSDMNDRVVLQGDFTNGMYTRTSENSGSVMLFEGEIEQATQAIVIDMFWAPIAGQTPIDSSSINASVSYIIFAGDKVGVYTGAGFLYSKTDLDVAQFRGSLWDSTLQLDVASPGFNDRMGLSRLSGDFEVVRNDEAFESTRRNLQQQVSEQLGFPRLVSK